MRLKILCLSLFASLLVSVEPKPKFDNETIIAGVMAHFHRVFEKVTCKVPQPRVFKLETEELRAMPHATIIHRCGESTGCCDFFTERCVAKKKERVKLLAFVMPRNGRGENIVQEFVFTNHTECYCESIMDTPK
ncbi:hypothetical protein AVEN_150072-1 [Araneus ventricosus]|uniref:Platelet-derived growth factor (PDGF) family profile domain-containing protein n=1 Tax=Araneus ventricosus TaxID=182803 RepID=A0A4Y2EVP8_ARAVE|nr:hypothetical protein AVEN_150072-1 [Araneus ventricosus]